MLSPGEFSVGCIGDVTTSLTLVLPRGRHEYPMLVTNASGSHYAIFLAGEHQFAGFECSNNDSWKGIIIPNVGIEVDENSIFNDEYPRAPLGMLVRRDAQLAMVTRADGAFHRTVKTPLVVGLPPCRENMSAAFAKWRVFLGEGTAKRELTHLEISNKSAD